MWREEVGCLEMLLAYYNDNVSDNQSMKSYRDFLFDLIECYEERKSAQGETDVPKRKRRRLSEDCNQLEVVAMNKASCKNTGPDSGSSSEPHVLESSPEELPVESKRKRREKNTSSKANPEVSSELASRTAVGRAPLRIAPSVGRSANLIVSSGARQSGSVTKSNSTTLSGPMRTVVPVVRPSQRPVLPRGLAAVGQQQQQQQQSRPARLDSHRVIQIGVGNTNPASRRILDEIFDSLPPDATGNGGTASSSTAASASPLPTLGGGGAPFSKVPIPPGMGNLGALFSSGGFPCILCSSSFKTQEQYQAHSCFQGSEFRCRHCAMSFPSDHRRQRHERNVHNLM